MVNSYVDSICIWQMRRLSACSQLCSQPASTNTPAQANQLVVPLYVLSTEGHEAPDMHSTARANTVAPAASLIPGRRGDEVHISQLLYQRSPATLIDLLFLLKTPTRTRLEFRGETTKAILPLAHLILRPSGSYLYQNIRTADQPREQVHPWQVVTL